MPSSTGSHRPVRCLKYSFWLQGYSTELCSHCLRLCPTVLKLCSLLIILGCQVYWGLQLSSESSPGVRRCSLQSCTAPARGCHRPCEVAGLRCGRSKQTPGSRSLLPGRTRFAATRRRSFGGSVNLCFRSLLLELWHPEVLKGCSRLCAPSSHPAEHGDTASRSQWPSAHGTVSPGLIFVKRNISE